MRRRTPLLVVAALALVLAAGAAFGATTSVTITTPKVNQKVALHNNPYLALAGTTAFASTAPGSTRFYLRRDACGTLNDNPHLSTTAGNPDGGDGCGLTVDSVAAAGCAGENVSTDYPANGSAMPFAYNGTQPINGQVSLTGAQAGEAQVEVTLLALVNGASTTIGTATGTALLDPTATSTPVTFTIPGNTSLDGADLQDVDLNVKLCGPNVYSQFTALSGASYFDLPDYAASVNKSVSVSIDDPTFAHAVSARLDGSSWSVAIPTPAVGNHTVYVQSHQGYDNSAVTTTAFKVTK
jgi:hypothetical protein